METYFLSKFIYIKIRKYNFLHRYLSFYIMSYYILIIIYMFYINQSYKQVLVNSSYNNILLNSSMIAIRKRIKIN